MPLVALLGVFVLALVVSGCHTPIIRGDAQLDRDTRRLFLNLMYEAPLIVLGQAEDFRVSPYVHRTPDKRQYPVRGYRFRLRVFDVLKGSLGKQDHEVGCYSYSSRVEAPLKSLHVESRYPNSAIFFLAPEGATLRCFNDIYPYWLPYYGKLPPDPRDTAGAMADAIAKLLLAFPREERRDSFTARLYWQAWLAEEFAGPITVQDALKQRMATDDPVVRATACVAAAGNGYRELAMCLDDVAQSPDLPGD